MFSMKKFVKDTAGGVAITFALASVPLVGLMGMGVEYAQSSMLQARMQAAGDNAGLAAASSEEKTEAGLTAVVRKSLAVNNPFLAQVSKYTVNAKEIGEGRIRVKIEAKLPTKMLRILGKKEISVSSTSIITRDFGNIDLALVLDNTGSMAGRKMSTLKRAAKELVNTVYDAKSEDSEVKIGLVPFSNYVNIGMSNRTKPWADIERDSTYRVRRTRWRRRVTGRYNCRWYTRYYYRDGVRRSYRYRRCNYRYGGWYQQTYWQTYRKRWYGCVGSRNYPWNTRDERVGYKIPGIMNQSCSRELTEMTTDKSKILRNIDAMRDGGSTYIPAGLIWGWRVVSEAEPFANKSTNVNHVGKNNSQKSIVLMTDGENTVSPTYPAHSGYNKTVADRLTKEICTNIKASKEKITIYTVAFEVHDRATKDMLRSCATSPSHFFDASDSAKLTASFQKIAKSLASLRIAE